MFTLVQHAAPELPVYVDQGMKYTDFLSITLTALAVMLAALAIALAGGAIWGYRTIKEEASKLARTAALEAAQATVATFLESPNFRDVLKSAVSDGKAGVAGQDAAINQPGQQVGRPYPRRKHL